MIVSLRQFRYVFLLFAGIAGLLSWFFVERPEPPFGASAVDVLSFAADNQYIQVKNTDDNICENLIIRSSAEDYPGLNPIIYFSVQNTTNKNKDVNIVLTFKDSKKTITNFQRFVSSTITEIDDSYLKDIPEVLATATRSYEPAKKLLNPRTRIETNDVWSSKATTTNSLTSANRKQTIGDYSPVFKDTILAGQTIFYKAQLNISKNTGKEEFFIEAFGSNAYGHLDPTINEIDSYSETNQDSQQSLRAGSTLGVGQAFTVGASDQTLDSGKFFLRKFGLPTGTATSRVYSATTDGSGDDIPNVLLATSDAYEVSGLTTTYQLITFTFSGAERITLSASTKYIFVFENNNDDASNLVQIGDDESSPTHAGDYSESTDLSSWLGYSTVDLPFYIYGTDVGGGAASPVGPITED